MQTPKPWHLFCFNGLLNIHHIDFLLSIDFIEKSTFGLNRYHVNYLKGSNMKANTTTKIRTPRESMCYLKRFIPANTIMRIMFALMVLLMTGGYAVAADTWSPIIGIPEPSFGITTSHTMYADESYTYDYGNGPEPYRIGPDGPYTHYIMPGHPNATDTGNPYGTVEKPRLTRPNSLSGRSIYGDPLPPGSVVEMHSGEQGGIGEINISGTSSLPIFIRGVKNSEPTFRGKFYLGGSNIVIENIKFDMNQSNDTVVYIGLQDTGARRNIAIRNCEFYNGQYNPSESYQVIRMKNSHNNADLIQNVVIYKNHFHNIGDGRTTTVKTDAVGVSIDANVKYVWVIGNTFNHIGGDAIQVAWDKFASSTEMPQYIYIGKNTARDCYENFLDLKMCQDVIVSENIAYNFGEGYSAVSGETSIPFRYGLGEGPDDVARNNVWTLFNDVYNCNSADGAFSSFTGQGERRADEIYYIGNIVYNSHNAAGTSTGFFSSGQNKVYWINNIAYNCDRAGYFIGDNVGDASTEKLTLVNNIFDEIHFDSTQPYNLMIGAVQSSLDRAVISNNIFQDSSGNAQFRVGVYNPPVPATWTTYSSYFDFCTAYPSSCTDSIKGESYHVDSAYATFQDRYGFSIQVD